MTIRQFDDLKGHTIVKIQGGVGDDEIIFTLKDGRQFMLYHEQDCCERVQVEDIVGDLDDLIGSPLTMAERISSDDDTSFVDTKDYTYIESSTWTFYKLATIKGYVTIRWFGYSNGYYSEGVDFKEIEKSSHARW